ncbi:15380_t:CDS:2, partial [Racocetra persica]
MATNIPNEILQAIFKFVDAKEERDYEKSDNVIKTLLSFLDNDQLQQVDSIRNKIPLIENKNDIELTLTVLLKMLARKITNVRRFHINFKLHSSNLDEVSKGDIKNNILKILLQPEVSDLLRFTNELRWFQTRPYKGYFVELAGICSNLEKLIISLGNFDESQIDDATEFIRSQTHLKELEIFNCNSGIQKLISFSREQALSIQTLILYHVDFYGCGPLTSLTKCENLRHLSFRYCTYIQKEMCNPLFSANFPKLKKVEAPFTSCPVLEEWAKNYS